MKYYFLLKYCRYINLNIQKTQTEISSVVLGCEVSGRLLLGGQYHHNSAEAILSDEDTFLFTDTVAWTK